MPRLDALAVAVLGALAGSVNGADFDADQARQLDRIDVTGTRTEPALSRRAGTATRLELDLLDVPASIEVLDQELLTGRGQIQLRDALASAPGLVAAYSFGVLNLAGRGFSGVTHAPILFDGIRYPGWQATPRLSLNYQQIEVLRGPAALAAGQGSISGAINLVPRRADGQEEQRLYLGYGRFGTRTAALGHGGSVGDDAVNYRIDLSHQGSDQRGSFGYARDTSFEFYHLNSELAIPVSDTLRLSVAVESFRDDAEGYFGTPLIDGRVDPSLRDINHNIVDDRLDMRVHWLRARAEWTPSAELSARIVAFGNDESRHWRNAESYTWLPNEQQVQRRDYLDIGHRQRLRGLYADLAWRHDLLGRPHQLVVGVQADRNDHDRDNNSPYRYTDRIPLRPDDRGIFVSLDAYGPRTATDINQRSAFAESDWSLADRWRLVAGYRYDHSRVDSFNALSQARFDKRYAAHSYRLGTVYSPTDSLRAYLTLATSTEPPAQITTLCLGNAAFDLTRSRQWEAGLKQEQGWGHWTAAVYDIRRSNLLSRDPEDANRLLQIGEQAATGIELSASIELTAQLRIEGHASALNARFRQFDEPVAGVPVSRRGNTPTAVPERVAALWLHYLPHPSLRLSAGSRAVGRSFGNTANTVELPGYATIDLMARYDTGRLGLFAVNVRNAADHVYATRPYGPNQALIGEPRWYELSWQYAF